MNFCTFYGAISFHVPLVECTSCTYSRKYSLLLPPSIDYVLYFIYSNIENVIDMANVLSFLFILFRFKCFSPLRMFCCCDIQQSFLCIDWCSIQVFIQFQLIRNNLQTSSSGILADTAASSIRPVRL